MAFILWSGLGQDSEKEDDGLVYDHSLLRLEMNEASDINEGGMSSAANGTYVSCRNLACKGLA